MFASLMLMAALNTAPPLPNGCAHATGFTGTICAPQTPGKHPALLLLGGSEGGDMMAYAAPELAQHGFVAASVAYFGMPGLPPALEEIPVETVGTALAAIAKRPDVDPGRIAIFGISKGGEFALLAASTYPQIRAVVADVPSPFAWQGIAQGPGDPKSSWTAGGKPVPYVAYSAEMGALFAQAYTQQTPLDLRVGYEASMKTNAAQIPAAMFHLENIRGPVLFVGAGDDRIWNSADQSKIGIAYLQAHRHPYADRQLTYSDAGHMFLFATPQRPMTQTPLGTLTMLLGGTAKSNVAAAAAAWPRIMQFLSAALK